MFGKINVINPEPVIQAFRDLSCGKTKVAQINSKDIELEAYETQPLEGFEFSKDFPFCCENHKQLFQHGVTALSKFPECCELHKKLNGEKWFNKEKYSYLPDKLVKTVSYTIHSIRKYINAPSWYELITDYVELTVKSYGQFPDGFGSPLGLSQYEHNVKSNIEIMTEISEEKKRLLLSYFDSKDQSETPAEKTDLNILIIAYQRWLKLFPFELHTYFGELKKDFHSQLPLLTGKVKVNRHTGVAKGKLHTKSSLIEFLMNLTDTLLTQINGTVLLEKGVITDAQKIQVELLTQERKQKIKEGYKNLSLDEEQRFRKMIKDWLYDERIFWKKLEPVLSQNQLAKPVLKNFNFQAIDNDLFTFRNIPFEIRFIYNREYNDSCQRFIEVKDSEYRFFTDYELYGWFVDYWKQGKLFTDYLEPLSHDNVKPYYKAYSEGFLKGYHEFDEKIKTSTAIFQNDQQAIINRVFESVLIPSIGLSSYGSEWLNGELVKTIDKKIWYEAGIKTGETYKAWFFILNNPSYFIDRFRKHKSFISFYKRGAKYWKQQNGGEGMYSHLVKLLEEIGESLDEDTSVEENNFLLSTIEDYLDPFRSNMNGDDYKILVQALKQYFETGQFPKPSKEINVFGKVALKKFGWALNEIYRKQKRGALPPEYVEFGKRYISIFRNVPFDKKKHVGCLLYKYYTTKPQ